jgi:hypothetical protein
MQGHEGGLPSGLERFECYTALQLFLFGLKAVCVGLGLWAQAISVLLGITQDLVEPYQLVFGVLVVFLVMCASGHRFRIAILLANVPPGGVGPAQANVTTALVQVRPGPRELQKELGTSRNCELCRLAPLDKADLEYQKDNVALLAQQRVECPTRITKGMRTLSGSPKSARQHCI